MSLSRYGIRIDTSLGPKYEQICSKKIEEALSATHYDVANAILWLYAKSPDTIDGNSYNLIYDPKAPKIARIYKWNYETKLWEPYEDNGTTSPKVKFFDSFIRILENIKNCLYIKARDLDYSEKDVIFGITRKINILIGKCKTVGYKNTVWKEIIDDISKQFIIRCNDVSKQIPLEDGTLYDIASGMRTPADYYTYSVKDSNNGNTGMYLNIIRN